MSAFINAVTEASLDAVGLCQVTGRHAVDEPNAVGRAGESMARFVHRACRDCEHNVLASPRANAVCSVDISREVDCVTGLLDQSVAQDRIEIPDRCSVIQHRWRYDLRQAQINGDRVALVFRLGCPPASCDLDACRSVSHEDLGAGDRQVVKCLPSPMWKRCRRIRSAPGTFSAASTSRPPLASETCRTHMPRPRNRGSARSPGSPAHHADPCVAARQCSRLASGLSGVTVA